MCLTQADIAAWLDPINLQFGVVQTNHHAYLRLKAALRLAVERGLIPASPATLRVAAPRYKRKELPTTEQMQAIYEQVPEWHKIIAALTLFHGLRLGEALALRRKDIEDTGKRIYVHVRGTAVYKQD